MRLRYKKVALWSAILISSLSAMFFGFQILTSGSIDHTIEKSRKIESAFQNAAEFVDSFIEKNHRLPTEKEFGGRQISEAGEFHGRGIGLNNSAEPLPKSFGMPPPGSYYLSLWRGEWEEYYAPWSRQSSLQFDEDAFFSFQSKAITLSAMIFSLLFLVVGIFLRKRF
jgi:hypothetical protein